jgi:hypothetical protein
MKTKHQKILIAGIAMLSIFLTTCKKDISVPNAEFEKLFGTWEWVESFCGWSGPSTPATVGYTETVEFNKNGTYKMFKDGHQQETRKFTLAEGSSIYTSGIANLIKYESSGLSNHQTYLTRSVSFGGEDTMYLNDEAYDACSYVYVRQK